MAALQGSHHLMVERSSGRAQAEFRPSDCVQLPQVEEISTVKTPERVKRDEWSEGGVTSLLDIYESKWLLRNRAKLKGSDWEDIARQVSMRNSGTKPSKTPNQCKNKIESMKKRYRAEIACNSLSGSSAWQFYNRMDGLLRGAYSSQVRINGDGAGEPVVTDLGLQALPKVELDNSEQELKRGTEMGRPQNQEVAEVEGQIQESNQEDGSNTLPDRKDSRNEDSDTSTPKSKLGDCGDGSRKGARYKRRKIRENESELAGSIRALADSILKIEHARVEMYKESERLRAEVEVKRSEMELKRTEVIAKTQLQIAKLLSKRIRNQSNKRMGPPPSGSGAEETMG
ncbi:hypothetical protein AMTR_s00019p00163540 [Amborella trichopoda]|uniref:Myb-like domain-containing protein n=1 Tax=Amborella trichopoda TaxID=13333 RepID=W1PHW1_AMBTC|nr:hypothetical protein AMTR_s00019p00163540 [Amborella trichopoda]